MNGDICLLTKTPRKKNENNATSIIMTVYDTLYKDSPKSHRKNSHAPLYGINIVMSNNDTVRNKLALLKAAIALVLVHARHPPMKTSSASVLMSLGSSWKS